MLQFKLLFVEESDGQITFLPKPKKTAPDLSEIFQAPVREDRLLPEAFEDTCKDCNKKIKRVPCNLWTKRRPHATFHCENCDQFLWIFTDIPKDQLIWSGKFSNVFEISKHIEQLHEERERDDKRRKLRHGK